MAVTKKQKENLVYWKPGQSGNPKGRPKRTITVILDELKAAGYKKVSKREVSEIFEYLLTLERREVVDAVNDESLPVMVRIIGRELLSKKGGVSMVERMLDRAHGKSVEQVDLKMKGVDLTGGAKQIIDKYAKPKTKAATKRRKPPIRRVVKGLSKPKSKAGSKAS